MADNLSDLSDKQLERVGYQIMRGAFRYLAQIMFWFFVIVMLLTWADNYFGFRPADDCDASVWQRCGAKIITDHKTGVQYLVTPEGGIVVRQKGDRR